MSCRFGFWRSIWWMCHWSRRTTLRRASRQRGGRRRLRFCSEIKCWRGGIETPPPRCLPSQDAAGDALKRAPTLAPAVGRYAEVGGGSYTSTNWEKGFDGFGICIGLERGLLLELVSRRG